MPSKQRWQDLELQQRPTPGKPKSDCRSTHLPTGVAADREDQARCICHRLPHAAAPGLPGWPPPFLVAGTGCHWEARSLCNLPSSRVKHDCRLRRQRAAWRRSAGARPSGLGWEPGRHAGGRAGGSGPRSFTPGSFHARPQVPAARAAAAHPVRPCLHCGVRHVHWCSSCSVRHAACKCRTHCEAQATVWRRLLVRTLTGVSASPRPLPDAPACCSARHAELVPLLTSSGFA